MRDLSAVLPAATRFDGAWCMGNSFGYLDPAGTARFLDGVAAVLADGARFVVDAATVAEILLPQLELGSGDERHAVGDVALDEPAPLRRRGLDPGDRHDAGAR